MVNQKRDYGIISSDMDLRLGNLPPHLPIYIYMLQIQVFKAVVPRFSLGVLMFYLTIIGLIILIIADHIKKNLIFGSDYKQTIS